MDALPSTDPVKLPVNDPLALPFKLTVLIAKDDVAGTKVILVAADEVVAKDDVVGINVKLVAADAVFANELEITPVI